MPHLDGAHSHGGGRWDWRYVLAAVAAVACLIPAGRSFLFAGLTEALILLAGGITLCVIALGAIAWRVHRKNQAGLAASRARQAQAALYQSQFSQAYPALESWRRQIAAEALERVIMSAQYGYPRHPGQETVHISHYDYSVHPELLQYGTVTGRIGSPPWPRGTTWPQRRDQEPDGPAEPVNPGHE